MISNGCPDVYKVNMIKRITHHFQINIKIIFKMIKKYFKLIAIWFYFILFYIFFCLEI